MAYDNPIYVTHSGTMDWTAGPQTIDLTPPAGKTVGRVMKAEFGRSSASVTGTSTDPTVLLGYANDTNAYASKQAVRPAAGELVTLTAAEIAAIPTIDLANDDTAALDGILMTVTDATAGTDVDYEIVIAWS